MSIFFSGQTKWIVLFVTDNVHWRCRRNGWNQGRNWVSEGEWYWLKAFISAVFNQMLTKICYFLSTGDWRTFKWKFDSGRWRCSVTRIRGDDKGLYFVPSAVLIFTLGSLIMSSRVGMGMHLWYKGYKATLFPRVFLLPFFNSKKKEKREVLGTRFVQS